MSNYLDARYKFTDLVVVLFSSDILVKHGLGVVLDVVD